MTAPRVPAPVSGVDVRSLPLSTMEGFVLSRVDGATSVDDISMISGIDKAQLLTILERLAELGAVSLSWYKARPKVATTATAAKSPDRPAPERKAAVVDHFESQAARYPATELDEPGDVPPVLKRRILNAYYGMEGCNFYELLGIDRSADKAAVRNAYFELSKVFHPDSLFGKDLGNFKPKMEAVFRRLTEAYEVLGKKKKRLEYDEYLGYTKETQDMQETLHAVEQVADSIRRSSGVPRPPVMPAEVELGEALRAPRVPDPERVARAGMRAPRSNEERRARVRDRLRRRFRSVAPPPNVASASAPPPPEAAPSAPAPAPESEHERKQKQQHVINELRDSIRKSASAAGTAHADRVLHHLEKARRCEKSGDLLGAASEVQLALALDGSNADLAREYERVSQLVAAQLADNYEKQARYEEKTGNWKAAASSWGRVADGRPDSAEAARSAAAALLKAGADLHRAQKFAEKATRIAPDSVMNLTVLARVYLAAGLKLNAKRELEKAAKLDPADEMVKNLMRDTN